MLCSTCFSNRLQTVYISSQRSNIKFNENESENEKEEKEKKENEDEKENKEENENENDKEEEKEIAIQKNKPFQLKLNEKEAQWCLQCGQIQGLFPLLTHSPN